MINHLRARALDYEIEELFASHNLILYATIDPARAATTFCNSWVVQDLCGFKAVADTIVANLSTPEIANVTRRFSREICNGQAKFNYMY